MEILNPHPDANLFEGYYNWRPSDPTLSCVARTGPEAGPEGIGPDGLGKPYEKFLCLYPWLEPWYTNFEKTWRPYWLGYYMRDEGWWIPLLACALYAIMIIGGRAYFKDRKAWNLRYALMLWNLSLSIFSLVGFSKLFPVVAHLLTNFSWVENLCFDPWLHSGHNEGGIWIFFFSLSKLAELFDTFFIIVHKKPLLLLHWYHHVSVLLYCWFFLIYTAPPGIYFCLMNYGVHTIMYFYYFLMSAKMKPKWLKPQVLTLIQIFQMIVGSVITFAGIYINIMNTDPHCFTKPINALPTLVMYVSYFGLFVKFFFDRYYRGKKEKMKFF